LTYIGKAVEKSSCRGRREAPEPRRLASGVCAAHGKENALRTEYGKLKQQAREYGIVKHNVDSILNPGVERARG